MSICLILHPSVSAFVRLVRPLRDERVIHCTMRSSPRAAPSCLPQVAVHFLVPIETESGLQDVLACRLSDFLKFKRKLPVTWLHCSLRSCPNSSTPRAHAPQLPEMRWLWQHAVLWQRFATQRRSRAHARRHVCTDDDKSRGLGIGG